MCKFPSCFLILKHALVLGSCVEADEGRVLDEVGRGAAGLRVADGEAGGQVRDQAGPQVGRRHERGRQRRRRRQEEGQGAKGA